MCNIPINYYRYINDLRLIEKTLVLKSYYIINYINIFYYIIIDEKLKVINLIKLISTKL